VSLNSFRPSVYAAYYRPIGYELEDVLESIRLAVRSGLRVSLNLLTHPGVTDDAEEVKAMTEFLASSPVAMIQTRTLNIDPEWYFDACGRPKAPVGMRKAIEAIRNVGVAVGNFTHTH
jgi:pyruvate-formate lyase-activating enzyme